MIPRANGAPFQAHRLPEPKSSSLWTIAKALAVFLAVYVAVLVLMAAGIGIVLGLIWLVLRWFGVLA